MSGHSKWANIKRQKQATDLIRGNVFSKLSRAITLAVMEGGRITDPEHNVKLRLAIDKAKQANMPKENIKRAIEKGSGADKNSLKEVIFEAFAPAGVALLIEATTDNLNRTHSEIRSVLEKGGGKIGSQGSVAYLFKKCGLITVKKSEVGEDEVFSFGQNLEAFDIDQDEVNFYIYIPFENLNKIKDYFGKISYTSAEVDYKPLDFIPIKKEDQEKKILNLIDSLENLDDVHKVYANFIIQNN